MVEKNPISIDTMREEEIPHISELLKVCYQWLGRVEDFPREFVEFLVLIRGSVETIRRESGTQKYLVAKLENEIVGMASTENDKITKLYVLPEYHYKGIGRRLFETAEKLIVETGFNKISLVALGQSPILFYRAMGMSVVEERKSSLPSYIGETITLMEKTISR